MIAHKKDLAENVGARVKGDGSEDRSASHAQIGKEECGKKGAES